MLSGLRLPAAHANYRRLRDLTSISIPNYTTSPSNNGGVSAGNTLGAVGHMMPQYLPRASTYIYTQLRFQQRFRPVVLTKDTANVSEFPLDEPVLALTPEASAGRRLVLAVPALLTGFGSTYEYAVTEEARRHGCLLIHAHHGWSGRPAVSAAARLEIPLITSFYGRDLAEKKRRRSFKQPYERLFANGTLFFCEGPASASHLERLGCPADRIRLVRIGIDLSKFPFTLRPRRRPLIVMQVARLCEKKGVDLSIRSFAAARKRLGPSELWIVGDGELRRELDFLASRLGVTESVRFAGELSHADYRSLAQRAHICIQPSRVASDGDTEGGAPTVLLEMQAVGIPIVATRHADIPFIVADHEHLADEEDVDALADALVELAGVSDTEYQRKAETGRAYVETEHDAHVVARAIEGCYIEALSLNGSTFPIAHPSPTEAHA